MRRYSIALVATLLSGAAGAQTFTLTSPDLAEGAALAEAQVADIFGCTGGNVSPGLEWRDAPDGTQSFVVTAYDPDAPTGSGWWHWVVYNIPASTAALPAGASAAGSLPDGAREGRTDFGAPGYGGACPPPGEMHRYEFKVHALSVPELAVPEDASPALIGFMTGANALATATLTATYTR